MPAKLAIRRADPLHYITTALVVLAGLVLRTRLPECGEFKADEALTLFMASSLLDEGRLPLIGIPSSVGVPNPPLHVWLAALVGLFSRDPLAAMRATGVVNAVGVLLCYLLGRRLGGRNVGRRAGLIAAAMFAVAPWAVIYSRKIWAPELLPPLTCLLLWATYDWAVPENPRPRRAGWIVLLAAAAMQLHLANVSIMLFLVSVYVVFRPRMDRLSSALGLAAAAVLWAPYGWHLVQAGLPGLKAALAATGKGMGAAGEAGRWAAARHLFNNVNLGNLAYLVGDDAGPFLAGCRIAEALASLQRWLFAAALAGSAAVWLSLAAAGGGAKEKLRREPAITMVILWMLSHVAVLAATGVRAYPHYLILAYPAPYVLLALVLCRAAGSLGLERAAWARRGAWAAVALFTGALFLSQGALDIALQNRLCRVGGAPGDYGTGYRFKRAAAEYIHEHSHAPVIAASHRADFRRPLDLEYRFFFWYFERVLKRSRDIRPDPRAWAFLVRDPHRAGDRRPPYPPPFNVPPRRFGPLEVYSAYAPAPR